MVVKPVQLALVVVGVLVALIVGMLVVVVDSQTVSVVALPLNRTLAQDFHAVQLC